MIKISTQFTTSPGPRFIKDGPFSGELFREQHLVPLLKKETNTIIVDLDDTDGYAACFLQEAFGKLQKQFPNINLNDKFKFISHQEKSLIQEIKTYIIENQ